MKAGIVERTYKDKDFLWQAASVAVPVTLTLVLNNVTNMVDTLMIGKLGTASISAVGLANKFFFVFALMVFGVHSGTGLLMAQFFGNNDTYHIRKTFGLGLLINLVGSLIFMTVAFLRPGFILHLFTNSSEAIEIGSRYLRKVCFCYPLFAATSIMSSMLRSTRNVKATVISSTAAIITNITLNYTLIFGHFGFRPMGVEGAAIATVIARLVECSILIYHSFIKIDILKGKLADFIGWSKSFINNFTSHSLPVIFNEMTWGLGTTLYFVAYGHISDEAVAAITISTSITDIITTTGNGLSSAASVLLGNELGAGRLEKAYDYSKKILVLGLTTGILMAALFMPFRGLILSIFDVSDIVRYSAKFCLTEYLLILPMAMSNLIIIVGVLRAGGDTKMCFIIDTAGVWFLAAPLAFLGAMVWHLPIQAIYPMVLSEEVFKSIAAFLRYRKKIWLKNLAVEV